MYGQQPPRKSETGDVWLGIALALFGIPLLGSAATYVLVAIHPSLGMLMLPLQVALFVAGLVISWRKGRKGIFKGMLIGLGVAFLLVAACFGVVFLLFMKGGL